MGLDRRFVKFTNYGDDFLNGKIYLNSLEYYRGIEKIIQGNIENRNSAVNDFLEGSVASVNPNDFEKFNLGIFDELKEHLIGNVHLLSEDCKYLKLLCFYTFVYDKEKNAILKPDNKLHSFEAKDAIIIKDADAFVEKMKTALDKQTTKIIAMNCGLVDYYENDEKTKILSPLHKTDDFIWQQEFRFIFKESIDECEATILEIGDISNIAIKVSADEFIDKTEKVFKNIIIFFEALYVAEFMKMYQELTK